jgi:exopolyphosphatase/guanosine-5'-triphosphate,3'-diphosphate pyrophosphatase
MTMERLAVIDMGSNSFRLVVFQFEPGSWWSLADEIREATRVSAGMGDAGVLQPEPMDRALRTATVYSSFLRASGVEHVDAVATSAIRDAVNRDELLDAVRSRTGLKVRVISGEEEARYGYLAIVNSLTLSDGFGIDVGGGSVQLMRIAARRLDEAASVRLGSVRVSEAFLDGEETSGKQIKALRKHVGSTLSEIEWWAGGERPRLAGIGGTIRNLATAVQKTLDLPGIDVQGFVLTRERLEDLIDRLASMPVAERGAVRGIKPDRGDVILGGAVVVSTAMEHGGFDDLEVTDAGLREGIFFEHLLENRDPPLLEDVRRESVINLAHRFRTHDVHVEHVARLSLQIFDALGEDGLHDLGDAERELLWAACMLHDIGVTIGYDDHHRHSRYLIESSRLPGFDPRELELIALIARWHRKGDPDPSELGDLERKGDGDRLRVLCGAICLAEQLERSRDQSVVRVELENRDSCVLVRAVTSSDPGSDTSVAIWSAQQGSDVLAAAIDKPVEVVGGEG